MEMVPLSGEFPNHNQCLSTKSCQTTKQQYHRALAPMFRPKSMLTVKCCVKQLPSSNQETLTKRLLGKLCQKTTCKREKCRFILPWLSLSMSWQYGANEQPVTSLVMWHTGECPVQKCGGKLGSKDQMLVIRSLNKLRTSRIYFYLFFITQVV